MNEKNEVDNKRTERQLQEPLDYAENIISTIREPLIVLDPELRIISANQSFYQAFSVTPAVTEGKLIYELGNGQWNIPMLRELLENILPKNTKFDDFIVEHEFADLGRRIMLLNARRIHDGGAKTQKILLAIEDVTDYRQAQHDLVSSELRYRRLFETAQDGILILNSENGEITDVNPFLSNMLGYSKEDLTGKKLWEIGFFKDTAASRQAFKTLKEKGYVRYEDLPLQSKDGQPMAVEFVSNVYSIDGENVIQCNIRDITERKKIEKAQCESEEKFRQLYYSMNEGTARHQVIYDDSGKAIDYLITDVNPAYESITGLRKETVVGRKASEVYGVNEPPYLDIYARVASTGKPASFETYFPPMEKYFNISVYTPERGKFATIFSNITERRLAEKSVRSTLEELKTRTRETSALLEGARAVLNYREFKHAARAIFDSCKNLIGVTGGYVALLNKEGTANEVLFLEAGGRPCDVDPSLPMPIRGLREKAYQSGKAVYDNDFAGSKWAEFMPEGHVALDNVMFAPLMLQRKPLGLIGLANKAGGFTEDDARMASAFADLAAIALQNSKTLELLETSEHTLRQSEERLLQAQALGNIGNWEFDLATQKIDWSNEVYVLYQRDKALGPPSVDEEARYYAPEETARLRELASRTIESGEESQCDVTAQLHGGKNIFLHASMHPVKDATGRVIKIFGTVQDITERKQAEEKINDLNKSLVRHTTELEAANKELEAFSYSVSHDLRAPLRGIDGFSSAVIDEYGDKLDEQGKEYLNRVRQASKHMSDLINDLLRLSRLSRAEMNIQDVNLSEVAQSVIEELNSTQPERKAEFAISPGIIAKVDKSLLTIALQNLLGNSWKFTNKCPLARIEFGVTEQSGEKCYFIRDNGAGFNMQYSDKLFQPFQRLHSADEYEGTGIGLALVQRVIRRHGGRVWAESEQSKGATFYFTVG
jgi:PAS domain S-box-containing protein